MSNHSTKAPSKKVHSTFFNTNYSTQKFINKKPQHHSIKLSQPNKTVMIPRKVPQPSQIIHIKSPKKEFQKEESQKNSSISDSYIDEIMSVNNESMNQTTKMEIEDTNQKFSNDNVSDIKNDAINIDDNSIDIECISDDDIDLSVGISDDKKLFSPIKKEESGMVQPLKMSEEHKLFNEEDIIKVTQNCCLFYHSSTITKQTKTCAEISKIFVYNLPHFLNAGNTLETVRDFIGTAKCPCFQYTILKNAGMIDAVGKEIVISNALSIFFKNQQKNNTFMYNLFILLNDVKYQNGVMEIIELLLLNYPSNMALLFVITNC